MRTFLAVATALWALGVHAADADRRVLVAQADAEKKQAAESTAVSYKPPLRGAPATRVGGGTRSIGTQALTVNVLAPNETGFTTRDKPTVYWYVSEPLNTPVELTLTTTEPLKDAVPTTLELTLQPPIAQGVHALRLGDHGVTLKPGVEYQWFVAVVSNPAQRSSDVVAGGGIKRIEAADAVRDGVWYDAIDQLSQQISANPADARLRQQRAALLEQVGLREAAAFDRSSIR
jgi:Domain of Unknown Function (DUF928)